MAAEQYWEEVYQKMDEKLQEECLRLGEKIPYILENGHYQEDMKKGRLAFGTNRFWAGILWQMYHGSKKEIYKETARKNGEAMSTVFRHFTEIYHDIGFQFLHTAVTDYRLTGDGRNPAKWYGDVLERGRPACADHLRRLFSGGGSFAASGKEFPDLVKKMK